MSNYTAFNQNHIAKLINPFDIYINQDIVPIKYEAITPDIFLFLFRKYGVDGLSHYYVAMEFDYIENTQEAKDIIKNWHGKVINFLPLYCRKVEDEPDFRTISAPTNYPYYTMLAEVEPPASGSGFWGENIIVRPGDDIDEKISQFTKKEQKAIHKGLDKIIEHEDKYADQTDGSDDDESKKLKNEIAIYKNSKGNFEFFYSKNSYNAKYTDVNAICRKLESTIKNSYSDSIKDLAYLLDSYLITIDDSDECYIQYPILEKISNACGEIETTNSVARQKKLLDEIKIFISALRDDLYRKSENIH